MVHTGKFYLVLSKRDVGEIVNKFSENITLVNSIIDNNFNWSKTSIYFDKADYENINHKSKKTKSYGRNCWILQVVVDFIKLLNKADICESDYEAIEDEMDRYMYFIFNHTKYKMVLTRLDYRLDVKMDKQDREVLLMLLAKSHQKHGFKEIKKTQDIIGKEKYKKLREANNMKKIQTSIYFQSKSTAIKIYDKEKERFNKGIEPESYEKDILRMEVMLYNKHLNYKKRVNNFPKELKTYLKKEFFTEYIKKNLEKFVHKGDFYKITISKKIIDESNLTSYYKKFLKEFLIDVSNSNLTNILEIKDNKGNKKYNSTKIRNALKMLQQLNINPISIPKNWKCNNFIKNPLNYIKN